MSPWIKFVMGKNNILLYNNKCALFPFWKYSDILEAMWSTKKNGSKDSVMNYILLWNIFVSFNMNGYCTKGIWLLLQTYESK